MTSQPNLWTPAAPSFCSSHMLTVKAIKLVLPETGSSIDAQLVLNFRSTLVNAVVKVELMGRGFLRWFEKDNPELDYSPGCLHLQR